MKPGFRILPRARAVPAAWVAIFRALPVANVSGMQARMTAGGPRLRPMHRGAAMAGPGLTVRTRPGGNLMIQKALSLAAIAAGTHDTGWIDAALRRLGCEGLD